MKKALTVNKISEILHTQACSGNLGEHWRSGGLNTAACAIHDALPDIPDGEKVEGAVGRLCEAVEQQVRWREDNPLFPCEKSPLNVGNARQLVAAARAELALREPEMIVEISESGKIISTIQRLTTESEGLRAGHYAIREIPDAPKPKVRPWRLKTTRWMCPECNHRAPAGSMRCGHCQALFDHENPRNLPEGDDA